MKTLEKAGPQLTSRLKGDWIGLYRWSPYLSHTPNGSALKAVKIPEYDGEEKVYLTCFSFSEDFSSSLPTSMAGSAPGGER